MALIQDSLMRLLLVEGKFDDFNRIAEDTPPALENTDLRSLDLREADLTHANLRGAYLRLADLRGVDLSRAILNGASLHGARIGGALFPRNLPADEIGLSVEYGTRMRATRD